MYQYLLCLSACKTLFVLLRDAEKYKTGENYLTIDLCFYVCYYGDDNKVGWNSLDM